MRAPLRVELFSKDFRKLGSIGAPKSVTVEEAELPAVSTFSVAVRRDERLLSLLMEPDSGRRLWVRDENGSHVDSGMIASCSASSRNGYIDVHCRSDSNLFGDVLGWVVPTAPITGQGTAGENWELEDAAETVLKTALQLNAVDRLGWPLEIAPDLGRGATIKAKLRFHNLRDRLWPAVDGAGFSESGLVAFIRQSGTEGLVMDVRERKVYPRVLSDRDGAVKSWDWNGQTSTKTDVVIGGQGEGIFRSLRTKNDPARAAALGIRLEAWRDARDVELGDDPGLYARGQETLDDTGYKNGLRVEFGETKTFRYGRNVQLGDILTFEVIPGGAQITDRLTAATWSWTSESGFRILPKIGDVADDADTIYTRAIAKLARTLDRETRT